MQTITRIYEFDAAHRVMNENMKCYNLHGHRFRVEITFGFENSIEGLGYVIDFKEIKRIAGGFIDAYFDHAAILNIKDKELIDLCTKNKWRLWIMGLGNDLDINPSAENIASELFLCLRTLFKNHPVTLMEIKLFETPNCWVTATSYDYAPTKSFSDNLRNMADELGVKNYDSRLD